MLTGLFQPPHNKNEDWTLTWKSKLPLTTTAAIEEKEENLDKKQSL